MANMETSIVISCGWRKALFFILVRFFIIVLDGIFWLSRSSVIICYGSASKTNHSVYWITDPDQVPYGTGYLFSLKS